MTTLPVSFDVMVVLVKPVLYLADQFVWCSRFYHIWSCQLFLSSVLSLLAPSSKFFSFCTYLFAIDSCLVIGTCSDDKHFKCQDAAKQGYENAAFRPAPSQNSGWPCIMTDAQCT